MKKKKLVKTIQKITGMDSIQIKGGSDKKLEDIRTVLDTDAVFRITKDNTVQASLPVGDTSEFQRRLFFIMSAFLKQVSTSGLVDPEQVSSRAIRDGLLAADLSVSAEEDDDDIESEEAKLRRKKYQ
jgi:hypothetical protein